MDWQDIQSRLFEIHRGAKMLEGEKRELISNLNILAANETNLNKQKLESWVARLNRIEPNN